MAARRTDAKIGCMEEVQPQQAAPSRTSIIAAPVSTASESEAWLTALRSTGPLHDQATTSLYALLFNAAHAEVARHRSRGSELRSDEIDDIATEAADDALAAVLAKLDDFSGASRFTTWAYKFALLEAGTRVRLRAWQHRDVVFESSSWMQLSDPTVWPASNAEGVELLQALVDGIAAELTSHQRCVLVSLAIDGVPIDVLAERLNTTRGALYRTLHDARQKLRGVLADRGLAVAST